MAIRHSTEVKGEKQQTKHNRRKKMHIQHQRRMKESCCDGTVESKVKCFRIIRTETEF